MPADPESVNYWTQLSQGVHPTRVVTLARQNQLKQWANVKKWPSWMQVIYHCRVQEHECVWLVQWLIDRRLNPTAARIMRDTYLYFGREQEAA